MYMYNVNLYVMRPHASIYIIQLLGHDNVFENRRQGATPW